jgi:hypothetical protein
VNDFDGDDGPLSVSGMIVHGTKNTTALAGNQFVVTVRKIPDGLNAGKCVIKSATCVIRFGMHQNQAKRGLAWVLVNSPGWFL